MTKKVRRTPKQQLTRKQHSRLQEERRIQRILMWGVGGVAVLIVGVLGYGVVAERIVEPRQPVAIVDEAPITTAEFQARVKFRRLQLRNQLSYLYQQQQTMAGGSAELGGQSLQDYFQQQIASVQSQLSAENAETLAQQVLDQMIQEELARQEAERRGLEVTTQEVQSAVEEGFGYDPDATPVPAVSPAITSTGSVTGSQPTPAPTPTQMTEADFQEMYNRYMQEALNPLNISEGEYRSWIKASLLTEKLQADMKKELPQEAEQVKLRFLSISGEDEAAELVSRLDSGEEFEALEQEFEEAEEPSGSSSELDWMPRETAANRLNEDIAAAVFELAVDEYTEPVSLGEGSETFFIFQVTGREERALADDILEQRTQEKFQSWLETQQTLVERKPLGDRVPMEP